MNKKTVISATDKTIHKLKALVKEKESIKPALAVTAKKLTHTAKQIVVTAKKNEVEVVLKEKASVRPKKVVTAKKLTYTAKQIVVTAKKNEAGVVLKEEENTKRKLAVIVQKLATIVKNKEDIRKKLVVTAKELAKTAKEKESIRSKLVVTAKEKEDVRKKLVVTAEQLAQVAKEREESNIKLQELDKLKNEFVSIASHELRTPLTAIDGLVSMTLDGEYGEVNKNLKQPLEDVNTSSDRLIHLVNDLLNLSRIQAGRLKYSLKEFNIATGISQIVNLFQPLIKDKELELKSTVLGKVTVQADSDKVGEILSNLIGNALKFTDKGSITVSAKSEEDKLNVYIIDTGIGIAKEDQAKLFGVFAQIGSSQSGRPVGTGLGLHISREIARKMGGELWIEKSDPGVGSTFAFSIPLAKSSTAQKAKKEIEEEIKQHPEQKSDTIKQDKKV